jgi:hypothetical protein
MKNLMKMSTLLITVIFISNRAFAMQEANPMSQEKFWIQTDDGLIYCDSIDELPKILVILQQVFYLKKGSQDNPIDFPVPNLYLIARAKNAHELADKLSIEALLYLQVLADELEDQGFSNNISQALNILGYIPETAAAA